MAALKNHQESINGYSNSGRSISSRYYVQLSGRQCSCPTTPYSGTFIPTLWSGKLTAKFYKTTIFGEISNTDYQGEISGMGDRVIINTIPDLTIKDYKLGGNLEYEMPQGETIDLVIDRGKYFAFHVNDLLELQSKPNLMSMFTDDATERMKISIDSDLLYRTFLQARRLLELLQPDT